MSVLRHKFLWLVAAVLALVAQSALSVVTHHYGLIGGDGPNFWGAVLLFTELPGAVIGEQMFGVSSPACLALGVLSGAAEWFVLFAIVILFGRLLGTQYNA